MNCFSVHCTLDSDSNDTPQHGDEEEVANVPSLYEVSDTHETESSLQESNMVAPATDADKDPKISSIDEKEEHQDREGIDTAHSHSADEQECEAALTVVSSAEVRCDQAQVSSSSFSQPPRDMAISSEKPTAEERPALEARARAEEQVLNSRSSSNDLSNSYPFTITGRRRHLEPSVHDESKSDRRLRTREPPVVVQRPYSRSIESLYTSDTEYPIPPASRQVAVGHSTLETTRLGELGLFALRRIREGQSLGAYWGTRGTDPSGVRNRSRTFEFMNPSDSSLIYWITADWKCLAGYANDPLRDHLVNAQLVIVPGDYDDNFGPRVELIALQDIEPGDEIFLGYGRDYWLAFCFAHDVSEDERERILAIYPGLRQTYIDVCEGRIPIQRRHHFTVAAVENSDDDEAPQCMCRRIPKRLPLFAMHDRECPARIASECAQQRYATGSSVMPTIEARLAISETQPAPIGTITNPILIESDNDYVDDDDYGSEIDNAYYDNYDNDGPHIIRFDSSDDDSDEGDSGAASANVNFCHTSVPPNLHGEASRIPTGQLRSLKRRFDEHVYHTSTHSAALEHAIDGRLPPIATAYDTDPSFYGVARANLQVIEGSVRPVIDLLPR